MEKANFGQIVSFLFGIANDCLVDTYDVGDYRKIILPMMVIRRFDAVLEPTKEKVLKMKEQLDAAGISANIITRIKHDIRVKRQNQKYGKVPILHFGKNAKTEKAG